MATINYKAATEDIFIRGDDAVGRTIRIGQRVTNSDIIVIDTDWLNVAANGDSVFGRALDASGGSVTAHGGMSSPTRSSSSSNEAFGSGALQAITSGFGNNAVGANALGSLTDGGANMGYGLNAGDGITSGDSNTCVGSNTMTRANVSDCTAIGAAACREISAGPNLGIGSNACKGDNTVGGSGTNNMGIGNNVLQVFTTGINNTGIGNDAVRDTTTGSNNIAIGRQAGLLNVAGDGNTYIGTAAGRDNEGSDNIFIGDGVGNTETVASNTLRLHNAGGSATPIIEGVMTTDDNRIGINTKTLNAKFNVVVGATDSPVVDCFEFTQNDTSENFGNFVATSSTGVGQPLTTWTTGNAVQGHLRIRINGTVRWLRFYDNPTS